MVDTHASPDYRAPRRQGARVARDRASAGCGTASERAAHEGRSQGQRRAAHPSRSSRAPHCSIACAINLGLTGTHTGCEHGICGACTVLLDGEPVRACLMLAVQADGYAITTIEAVAPAPGELSIVQDAFCETHGLQCGYCTPGMILTRRSPAAADPGPDRAPTSSTPSRQTSAAAPATARSSKRWRLPPSGSPGRTCRARCHRRRHVSAPPQVPLRRGQPGACARIGASSSAADDFVADVRLPGMVHVALGGVATRGGPHCFDRSLRPRSQCRACMRS